MNGRIVAYNEGSLHVGSSALHFGPTAFEGIRCYAQGDGVGNLFRLREHVQRLQSSCEAVHLQIPFSESELMSACVETVRANEHWDGYVRPVVFPKSGTLGFGRSVGQAAEVCVLSFPWENAPLEKSQRRGIRVHISSVIRTEAHPVLSKSKIAANYSAGLLAIYEARKAGCDEAFLQDCYGTVAEASTANIFAVWGNRLRTPPSSLPILKGITRDTLLTLAAGMGLNANEEAFTTQELAQADEVFISGTTCEVTPVREINGRKVGECTPGPVTMDLLCALQAAIRGEGFDRGWTNRVERAYGSASC
jgi:branched-chain amino acid aminotransferase